MERKIGELTLMIMKNFEKKEAEEQLDKMRRFYEDCEDVDCIDSKIFLANLEIELCDVIHRNKRKATTSCVHPLELDKPEFDY